MSIDLVFILLGIVGFITFIILMIVLNTNSYLSRGMCPDCSAKNGYDVELGWGYYGCTYCNKGQRTK